MHPRRDARLLVLGLIPFLILVVAHWSMLPLLTSGDYAQYLSHADALLNGRPYTDIGYIWSPYAPFVGPRAQPPGLALTLVPIIGLFGPSMVVMKLLMVVSGSAFLFLSGWYIARRTNVWVGLTAMLMTGTALEVAYASNVPLSDLGFAALIWGVIMLVDAEGPWSNERTFLITILGLAAMSYRVPGVALVPAMAIYAVTQEPRIRRRALIPCLTWAALLVTAYLIVRSGVPLADLLGRGPHTIIKRALNHAIDYPRLVLEIFLYPFASNRANDILHVGTAVLSAIGLATFTLRYRRSFLVAFVVTYALMLFVAPVKEGRYAWPLYPVMAMGYASALGLALGAVLPRLFATIRTGTRAFGPVLAFALTAVLMVAPVLVQETRRPAPPTLLGHTDTRTLFDTVRSRGERQPMRVMFTNPRVLTWETGVPAMALLYLHPDTALREMRKREISHVVVGDLRQKGTGAESIDSLIRGHPSRFELEYRNPSFSLFRFTDAAPAAVGSQSAPAQRSDSLTGVP